MTINQRRKGHSFERRTVRELKDLGIPAQRVLEYQEGKGYDVESSSFVIQCKIGKRPNPRQAYKEVEDRSPDGKFGVVRCKWDRSDDLAVMSWKDFKMLIEMLVNEGILI